MSSVALVRCETYDPPEIESAVRRAVDLCGGISRFVKPGDRVLLKVNMLSARTREKRVTTDPEVAKSVARLVLDAGGRPFIGDSPGLGSFKRVASKTELDTAARDCGIDILELDRSTPVSPPKDSLFRQLEIASPALEADVVINLPKLKTHCQMVMTLGVKNLFGTIVGQRKAEWHHMAGVDRDTFASLLLDVYLSVHPVLTILDGVWGMEGLGPSNGTPRRFNLIAASEDAVALDVTVCRLMGVPLTSFPVYRTARSRGVGETDARRISLVGDGQETFSVSDFAVPQLDSLHILPGMFEWFTRRYMVSKPVHDRDACAGCGQCLEICPSKAIQQTGRKITFDYDTCIRCYCCQEICPEDAIGFRKGWIVRFLNAFNR
jgi:uncharacterized protein (DUF362 family)/ferredoxin